MGKLRLLGRLAGQAGIGVRRRASAPIYAATRINARAPDRLLIAPQDIRTADPTIAAEIYAGYFAFGGKIVNTHGRLPFEIEDQDPEWVRPLNGFGWLRHLRAANSPLATANARTLVDDFLTHAGKPKASPAWEPAVVARRILSFLAQSPMILDGADHAFYRRFMRALVRSQRFLERELASGLAGEPRLLAAMALAELGLCAQGSSGFQRKSTKLLAEELDRQILPDGGHISRNPKALARLLLDLLPLRQAYAAQALSPPQQLLNAIDRMLPMLRMLRHGDGTLALFNGMGVTAPDLIATVLAYDDASAQPLTNAPYSGYQRVEAADSVMIVDTGRVPPPVFSQSTHAGCLSFELSAGNQKLVVNCGAPHPHRAIAREPARATAAHSTLVIADTSACRFAGSQGLEGWFKGQILTGPARIAVERQQLPKRIRLRLAHDGYASRFGLVHERHLTLASDGLRLDGEERLRPAARGESLKAHPYAVRFHIHPSIQLQSAARDHAVILTLPDASRWIFDTQATQVAVEESIYFAAAEGPHACEQIVIYGDTQKDAQIAWSFRRFEDEASETLSADQEADLTQDIAPE
ncbi:MAG: heparinase [Beijerinckiaceae bacterium]|nr:MAG: heparinase [Beijerinckiaceae bacterium]